MLDSKKENAVGEFSLTHILLVLVLFLIFFGPSRLPGLGQSLGKAIKGFKDGLNEVNAESKPVNEVKNSEQLSTSSTSQHSQEKTEKMTTAEKEKKS